jgi:hypothetical protein
MEGASEDDQSYALDVIGEAGWRQLSLGVIESIEPLLALEPDLAMMFQRSLAVYYRPIVERGQRLKAIMRSRTTGDPAIVIAALRKMHDEGTFPFRPAFDRAVDWLLEIEQGPTEAEIRRNMMSLDPRVRSEQYFYAGTPYVYLSAIVRELAPTPEDVFYDLGSGYGRPTLVMGMLSGARARGIEMVAERVARANAAKEWLGLGSVDYRLGFVDDPAIDMSDGTIFFLFNPFREATLFAVIDRLLAIAAEKGARGERIRIVSYGDCTSFFETAWPWLRCVCRIGPINFFESY